MSNFWTSASLDVICSVSNLLTFALQHSQVSGELSPLERFVPRTESKKMFMFEMFSLCWTFQILASRVSCSRVASYVMGVEFFV